MQCLAAFFNTLRLVVFGVGAGRQPSVSRGSFATGEAARAVRDNAFNYLQLECVISLIHPENLATRRVAEKNGMVPEKETLFRGFPTIVFGINRAKGNGR